MSAIKEVDQTPWLDRVKALLGPRGYDHSMRRSIQTLVIYEAKRCIQPRVGDLRPFQRKVALVDQAQALVNSLDFCLPHHKAEILWRTSTSRETVTPEIAWKRFQLIQKELDRLAEQVKQFVSDDRSHQESVDLLEQHLFETSGDNQGKPNSGKLVPPNWGHAHNHVLLCFRLYYRGDDLDPDFPEPILPKTIVVPTITLKEPLVIRAPIKQENNEGSEPAALAAIAASRSRPPAVAAIAVAPPPLPPPTPTIQPPEQRQKVLQEIKDHLFLLKEFEGIAPEDELEQRRKELYAAMPPAPPPFRPSITATGSPAKRPRQSII